MASYDSGTIGITLFLLVTDFSFSELHNNAAYYDLFLVMFISIIIIIIAIHGQSQLGIHESFNLLHV